MKLSLFGFITSFCCVSSLLNNIKFPKISGFYGLIGPNVNIKNTDSLFDLFTSDGIIHGVFIEDGKIFPVKHVVQTEKILFEKKYFKFSKNYMMLMIYIFLNKLNLIPNVLGLSNTAFLDNNNKIDKYKKNILTTCEMDKPYKIQLDFNEKNIKTLSKVNVDIERFSGHSKFDSNTNKIQTIDYDMFTNKVTYYELNKNCQDIISKNEIPTRYIPNVHDFIVFDDKLFFIEPPFVWNFLNKIPLTFHNAGETKLIIYDLKTKKMEKYKYTDHAFLLFHYADFIKKDNKIEILAPLYDHFCFSNLNIEGKYRNIILNTKTKEIKIEKNEELEKMNLDFPLKWKDYILLIKIENKVINELVLCKKLNIVKKIKMPKDRFLCGEPAIVDKNSTPYVIGIAYDSENNGYFFCFNMFDINNSYIEKKLEYKPTIGFHSIFTKRK